jgi:hypothetical protein
VDVRYRPGHRFKLVLDRALYMDGPDQTLTDAPEYDLDDSSVRFCYTVRYVTERYADRIVTLRTSADQYRTDQTGVSVDGAWNFLVGEPSFHATNGPFEIQFALDSFAASTPRALRPTKQDTYFADADMKFVGTVGGLEGHPDETPADPGISSVDGTGSTFQQHAVVSAAKSVELGVPTPAATSHHRSAEGRPNPPDVAWPIAVSPGGSINRNTMRGGQRLEAGQTVTSPNGLYRFTYQSDGNLVLYGPGGAMWDSRTSGAPVGFCIMEADGNLVIHGPENSQLWATGTDGNPGSHLLVQDDGSAVICRPDSSAAWDTDTFLPTGPLATGDDIVAGETLLPGQLIGSANGQYVLGYQVDGNLVLSGPGGPVWNSQTSGTKPGVCIMQHDGNLVVYEPGATPVWASATDGNPGSRLLVQDDGNLVIYQPDGSPIWNPT